MNSRKITVVGAGNVGASLCYELAQRNLCSTIVFIDIFEDLVKGKALDIEQSLAINGKSSRIIPTTNYKEIKGSELVIITAGSPRKPGMSRDDLLLLNAKITKSIAEQIATYASRSIIIEVANPLDAMVYVALQASGFEKNRVLGMAGVLDSGRMGALIAKEAKVGYGQVNAMVLGGHGDDMVPLPRYSTINGVAISHFLTQSKLEEIIKKTRNGGAKIVSYLNTSAYYAPAMGAVIMAEAILNNTKTLFPCAVYLDGEYGYNDVVSGVPVVLGKNGVEKIEILDLNEDEKSAFDISINSVKSLIKILKNSDY